MYICVCNAIKERDIKRALESGVQTVSGIYRFLNRSPQCGTCAPFILKLMRSHRLKEQERDLLPEAAD